MPINFLKDRYRLTRLGRIRLGHKVQKQKKDGKVVEYPVADPFFVLSDELQALFGPRPTELEIQFLFDSIELTFPHYLRRYTRSGLRCLGDGLEIMYRINDAGVADVRDGTAQTEDGKTVVGEGGVIERVPCTGDKCDHYISGECKPTGNLKFAFTTYPRMGYYDIICRQRAVVGVRTALLLCLQMFGRLTDIPFILRRGDEEKIPVKTPKGMVDMPVRTQWVEIDPTWFAANFPRKAEICTESVRRRYQLAQQAITDLFGANGGEAPTLALPDPVAQFEEELFDGEGQDDEGLVGEDLGEPATPPDADPTPVTIARPHSPAALREFLQAYAKDNPRSSIKDGARGLLVGKLDEAMLDETGQSRHLFCEYVAGEQSSKKLKAAMVNAMLQWLISEQDKDTNEYVLDKIAVQELAMTVSLALREAGQMRLGKEAS